MKQAILDLFIVAVLGLWLWLLREPWQQGILVVGMAVVVELMKIRDAIQAPRRVLMEVPDISVQDSPRAADGSGAHKDG